MNLIVLQPALDDLVEITAYFNRISERLGQRFRRCVEKSIGMIMDFPRASAAIRQKYRIRQISRFRNYGILYRIQNRCIFIHGIFYLSRGPKFWGLRLG